MAQKKTTKTKTSTNKTGKHPGGRPTKYRKEFVEQATKLCMLGATDVDLADFFKTSVATIGNWKNKYPEFLEALDAKTIPNKKVEKSLYELALGYEHEVEKPMVVSMGRYDGSEVQIVKYKEKLPPNVHACLKWLQNRDRDRWREKYEVEITDMSIGNPPSPEEADFPE